MAKEDKGKIYSVWYQNTLNAGLGESVSFAIISPNREIQIKRLTINRTFRNITATQWIPEQLNTTQNWQLVIGDVNTKISLPFSDFTGTAPAYTNSWISFYNSGQYNFESFFLTNRVDFGVTMSNNLAGSQVRHDFTIIVQTVERVMN